MASKTIKLAEHSMAKREVPRKEAISINTLTNDHKKSYIELALEENNPTGKLSLGNNRKNMSAISDHKKNVHDQEC